MTVKNIGISCTTRRQHKYPLVESEALTGHERIAGTGYIQAWPQEKLSSVSFSIRPAHSWDVETKTYADELTRDSDVYVFCLHNHIEQESLNILDLSQWKFFVLLTRSIEAGVGMQKTITLNCIKSLGAIETDYDNLRDTIINAIRRETQ